MNRLVQLFCVLNFFVLTLSCAGISDAATLKFPMTQPTVNQADQHVVWRREPIQVTLPVGQERFVSFPSAVQFGYNIHELPASLLRVENDNRTLYLLAKKPFTTQRVEAKLASGTIILLDIKATRHASHTPLDIVLPTLQRTNSSMQNPSTTNIDYVTLTRYAIQQLYAPKRLLKQLMGITRFPMETTHVVRLFDDGSVATMPLASWRGSNLYVTALLVKNILHQSLRLDPRLMCGEWKSASFYPQTTLLPRGTSINRDTSTVFVISNEPFAQAIQSCVPNV